MFLSQAGSPHILDTDDSCVTPLIATQGFMIQSATLDFTVNATVSAGSAGGSATTELVSLGPSVPVGLSTQVRRFAIRTEMKSTIQPV